MGQKGEGEQSLLAVCVVEYNPLAARYLEQLLAADPALEVIPHQQVLAERRGRKLPVATFVLDRGTLPMALSKFLRHLRLRAPHARILVIDDPLPDEELCRLLFLGIQGFLSYEEVDPNLARAVRAVADGHLWVAPAVVEQYVRYTARLNQRGEALTSREQRIVELVLRRLSNKEIGSILRISESTVKFHLVNIFGKLGVRDRESIIEVAASARAHLIQPQKSK